MEAKALCLTLGSEIQSSDSEHKVYRGRSAFAPRGEKASGKSAERVRTLHEPLNPNATTTVPTTLLPSPVAEATVREDGDDQEAPTDAGANDMHLGHGHLRNMEAERIELVQRQKQATKERKDGSRRLRDATRLEASLSQTRDMGTPRAAGTRSTVQTTCMDGLMPKGVDGQAAGGQGVFTNPGGAEGRERKSKPVQTYEQLESLQEVSRQRILPPAEPAATPASGRSADE